MFLSARLVVGTVALAETAGEELELSTALEGINYDVTTDHGSGPGQEQTGENTKQSPAQYDSHGY